MFVDASAIVAILQEEEDATSLAFRLADARDRITSPLALWEATIALARENRRPVDEADTAVSSFVAAYELAVVPITPAIGALATEASRRFGRGRHRANLNLGDCFAYGCAKAHRVPLLFKGEDFSQTDIEAA